MDGRMDGWTNGGMEGLRDGWIERPISVCVCCGLAFLFVRHVPVSVSLCSSLCVLVFGEPEPPSACVTESQGSLALGSCAVGK